MAKNTKFIRSLILIFLFNALVPIFTEVYTNASENLIINNDFEKGYGWEDWGGFSFTSDPKQVYSGKTAGVVRKGEGGAGNEVIMNIKPGETYTLSGYGKVDGVGQVGILGAECLDSEGKKIKGGRFIVTFNQATYVNKTITFSTVAGTSQLYVYLYIIDRVEGGAAYFDELRLSREKITTNSNVNNAAFLPKDWFNTVQSSRDAQQYIDELKSKKIKYQFADIGLVNDDGLMSEQNYAGLANWISNSKKIDPKQYIIAVINYNNRIKYDEFGNMMPNDNFGTDTFNKNINSLVEKLVNRGIELNGTLYKVDGIHIDFESFISDDQALLSCVKFLRNNALANNNYFSISAPVNYSVEKTWSDLYIGDMAKVVNQINPMLYDLMGWQSPIDDPEAYQNLCKQEVQRFSDAIGNIGPNKEVCQLLPFIPSYERRMLKDSLIIYHDPYVENILSAVKGIKDAVNNGANVYGAGIFWWPSFIGHYPFLYQSNYYIADQDNWMKYWVNTA